MSESPVGRQPLDRAAFESRLRALVSRYRTECLWDLKTGLDLDLEDGARIVLQRLASCADLSGYVEARELLNWLSHTSNAQSAAS